MPLAEIRHALELLVEPGSVVELRVPKTRRRGTISGYFNDWDALAHHADALSGQAEGVYITANPVAPDLARCANHVVDFARHTTTDADIIRRRRLLIEFDPCRASGISSTDIEHQAALDRARRVRDWLGARGRVGSILADSGNGGHLLYPIDLPNDGPSATLLKRCLDALDLQFSDGQVIIDSGTANAARLVKVYGTMACKGDPLPERPHRLSRIINSRSTTGRTIDINSGAS
jgi:hypothetical protein